MAVIDKFIRHPDDFNHVRYALFIHSSTIDLEVNIFFIIPHI